MNYYFRDSFVKRKSKLREINKLKIYIKWKVEEKFERR